MGEGARGIVLSRKTIGVKSFLKPLLGNKSGVQIASSLAYFNTESKKPPGNYSNKFYEIYISSNRIEENLSLKTLKPEKKYKQSEHERLLMRS